jgi:hypothetical protein
MSRELTPESAPLDGQPTDPKPAKGISRREFARRAALVSAVAPWAPANAALAQEPSSRASTPQFPGSLPKLSPESQAEVDTRFQAILNEYGSRLSNEQKIELRRLCTTVQLPLDRLRAYSVENSDGPGLYLKPLFEREKKPPAPAAPSPATKQPAAKPPAASSAPGPTKKP